MHDVRYFVIACQVSTDTWFKWLMFRTYKGSNFKYMVTKIPFGAGDYLIFRPKVDQWVDSTQCDYGGWKVVGYLLWGNLVVSLFNDII